MLCVLMCGSCKPVTLRTDITMVHVMYEMNHNTSKFKCLHILKCSHIVICVVTHTQAVQIYGISAVDCLVLGVAWKKSESHIAQLCSQ